jgi:hypothetical protein
MVDLNVQYQNMAGTYVHKIDGNTLAAAPSPSPRVLIIGTAGKGVGSTGYYMPSTSQAKQEFGSDGTLLRGMYESRKTGANDVILYRLGATSAKVSGIGNSAGGAGGYVITTIQQDEDAGGNYAFYYDDSEDRLVVKRNSDDLVVYDNDPTNPIERYEVTVGGYRASGGGPDIGSPSSFVNMEDVDGSTYAGTSFTAGTDGLSLSRMEMYEKLYEAYENLKQYEFDVAVPMDVYLDDYNVVDQGHYLGAVTPEAEGVNTYPTAGSYKPGVDVDALGRVFVEEYEGSYYFWWWFNDGTGVFSGADIWPSGAPSPASSTVKIDGTALTADDFHEVNFGYQLARFLYEYSTNIVDATGVIGVLPPASNDLVDRARWLGKAPTWTLNTALGSYYVASSGDNGSGLLGNKFLVGRNDHRAGVYGGGMIATDGKFIDSGDELEDDNGIPIDLGKYISVAVDYPLIRSSYSSLAYAASFAASYAGFYVLRSPASAPTNKKVENVSILFNFNLGDIDSLAGAGYVKLRRKPTGIVVADAPTAAMPLSDWKRLSTVRIAKSVIDGVRLVLDPFLGEGTSSSTRSSMHTAVENILIAAKKGKYLQDYKDFDIIQTPDMEVQGKVTVNLILIPAFEIRQITLSVSISKSG